MLLYLWQIFLQKSHFKKKSYIMWICVRICEIPRHFCGGHKAATSRFQAEKYVIPIPGIKIDDTEFLRNFNPYAPLIELVADCNFFVVELKLYHCSVSENFTLLVLLNSFLNFLTCIENQGMIF